MCRSPLAANGTVASRVQAFQNAQQLENHAARPVRSPRKMSKLNETGIATGLGRRLEPRFASPAGRADRDGTEGLRGDGRPPVAKYTHVSYPSMEEKEVCSRPSSKSSTRPPTGFGGDNIDVSPSTGALLEDQFALRDPILRGLESSENAVGERLVENELLGARARLRPVRERLTASQAVTSAFAQTRLPTLTTEGLPNTRDNLVDQLGDLINSAIEAQNTSASSSPIMDVALQPTETSSRGKSGSGALPRSRAKSLSIVLPIADLESPMQRSKSLSQQLSFCPRSINGHNSQLHSVRASPKRRQSGPANSISPRSNERTERLEDDQAGVTSVHKETCAQVASPQRSILEVARKVVSPVKTKAAMFENWQQKEDIPFHSGYHIPSPPAHIHVERTFSIKSEAASDAELQNPPPPRNFATAFPSLSLQEHQGDYFNKPHTRDLSLDLTPQPRKALASVHKAPLSLTIPARETDVLAYDPSFALTLPQLISPRSPYHQRTAETPEYAQDVFDTAPQSEKGSPKPMHLRSRPNETAVESRHRTLSSAWPFKWASIMRDKSPPAPPKEARIEVRSNAERDTHVRNNQQGFVQGKIQQLLGIGDADAPNNQTKPQQTARDLTAPMLRRELTTPHSSSFADKDNSQTMEKDMATKAGPASAEPLTPCDTALAEGVSVSQHEPGLLYDQNIRSQVPADVTLDTRTWPPQRPSKQSTPDPVRSTATYSSSTPVRGRMRDSAARTTIGTPRGLNRSRSKGGFQVRVEIRTPSTSPGKGAHEEDRVIIVTADIESVAQEKPAV